MRSNRARMSCSVLLRAWPICSRPVTLGGGMTMEKAGAPGRVPHLKAPDASHWAAMRCSTSWGLKVLSSIRKKPQIRNGTCGFFLVRSSPGHIRRESAFCAARLYYALHFGPHRTLQEGREMLVHPFADQRFHAV